MVVCSRCQSENRDGSTFCVKCGEKLAVPPLTEIPKSVATASGTLEEKSFRGALGVSIVFKVSAVIWILAGFISILETQNTLQNASASSSTKFYLFLIELAVTALGAATFGFFAYVIDLLMAVEKNTQAKSV
jgi:hypothetical protein